MKKILFFLIEMSLAVNINAQIINTVAGDGILGYSGDGSLATLAKLHLPGKIAFDSEGNLYVADSWGHRIRRVDAVTDIITTIAGTGTAGYNGDNITATSAQLYDPVGLAFDTSGNLYIADNLNQRIRKISMATGIITTVAGNGFGAGGIGGYNGDGISATTAELSSPTYITFDPSSNLYISDGRNYRIRKVDVLSGVITTIAGNGMSGYTGDGGTATSAQLMGTQGIAFYGKNAYDASIYLADSLYGIRKINLITGIITTVAGNAGYGYSGDGSAATAAQIQAPFDITFDAVGNYYIAEFNGRIREVDTFGIIHTVAGTTIYGYNGDGIPATTAELNETTGVSTDACGNLYIADVSNERIRKVTMPPIYTTPTITLSGATTAAPGATVTVNATVGSAGSSYEIYWYNDGVLFATTTVPMATYTQTAGTDTITALIVPTGYGCYDSAMAAPHVVTAMSTGIQRAAWGMGVHVYPNPASNVITVAANNGISNITITNLVGQTVYNMPMYQCANKQIDVSDFPAGVYFVVVTDDVGNKTVRKIVKE